MMWNWQQPDWPSFSYDAEALISLEMDFQRASGVLVGLLHHINEEDRHSLTVELIGEEALNTSEIEGEHLDRDSLQSSLRRNFGLATDHRRVAPAEEGIAKMMTDLYQHYDVPLSHNQLHAWHDMLMLGRRDLQQIGRYRSHNDPMQVVSGKVYEPTIHFEAPPSSTMPKEMDTFIEWFNATAPDGSASLPPLTRAGLVHLYFVSIHPFEDGNGRIARALCEKALSQCLGQPTLLAISAAIQKNKKAYYDALEANNKQLHVTDWLVYFGQTILAAHTTTKQLVQFLIEKAKLFDRLRGQLNARQEKALLRLFREGPDGFKGGMSSANYQAITKASAPTATRDLADLVSKDVLRKTGDKRGARYWLAFTAEDSGDQS